MGNLIGASSEGKIDKIQNEEFMEVCDVNKFVNEIINRNVIRWFNRVKKMMKVGQLSGCIEVSAWNRPTERPKGKVN